MPLNSGLAIRAMLCRLQLRTCHTRPTFAAPVKVLYDGLCPICVTEIRFLQFLQRKEPGKVDFIDITLPGYDGAKHNGISYEMAMEAMHVIDEKNTVHRGIPAFDVMYSAVGLGWLGRLLMWPPIRPLVVKSYNIFARNRLKWTGRRDECTTGRCEKKNNLNSNLSLGTRLWALLCTLLTLQCKFNMWFNTYNVFYGSFVSEPCGIRTIETSICPGTTLDPT